MSTNITMDDVLARRRENLRRLCLQRFDNNRAAMARTAVLHPNQVNLMLVDNPAIRRPMTEAMARKIEKNLSLPEGYFDQVPTAAPLDMPPGALVIAPPVLSELEPVLSTNRVVTGITVSPSWLNRYHVADASKLWLACVACDGLEPEIENGDAVVLETMPADNKNPNGGFTRDGFYVLATKGGPILRRVQRGMDGFTISSPNPTYPPEPRATLRGVIFYARVVCALRFT